MTHTVAEAFSVDEYHFDEIVQILKNEVRRWREPIVSEVKRRSGDPYQILISTLLSLRSRDEQTRKASESLFALADTPRKMSRLLKKEIARAIHPVGFYNNKAETILTVSETLLKKFGGKVPETLEELLSLKGVGRKTANLVLIMGFNKDGICVDTHVHRISNRLGWVQTKMPDETEMRLREILPKRHWKIINDLLVPFGQNLCSPISPFCNKCPVHLYCKQIGVTQHR